MENKLILASDRGKGKAFKKYLALGIVTAVMGFVLCCAALLIGTLKAHQTWGREREIISLITSCFAVIFGIMAAAGIAAPFLGMYDAKKCYVDVYETYVSGSRVIHRPGSIDQYEAFQLSYDKITGAAAQKNKVFLYVGGSSLECHAFNADEICREIQSRIH